MAEEIKVTVHAPIRAAKSDERFLLFVKRVSFPITEEQIISFYSEYVQRFSGREVPRWRNNVWVYECQPYTDAEIRSAALAWFDRSFGRAVRKQLIQVNAVLPQSYLSLPTHA